MEDLDSLSGDASVRRTGGCEHTSATPETVQEPILITQSMLASETPAAAPSARETRIDFEQDMSAAPPVTLAILATLIFVFILEAMSGALQSKEAIIAAGALDREKVMDGEIWRLISAIFLHGGPGHLIGNCFGLYVLGMACEHAFGRRRFALLFVIAGLGGSILSVLATKGPSVGASGAIFGLQAAVVVFFYRFRRKFFLRDRRIGFVLLVWGIYEIGNGFLVPLVDNFAHLGGIVAGTLAALNLTSMRDRRDRADHPLR